MDPSEFELERTQHLLEAVRADRPGARERLFARHREYLRQVIRLGLPASLRPRIDASDIMQEAQLEAVRRLPDFLETQPIAFHVWLRRIAHDRLVIARRHHFDADRRAASREIPLPDRSSLQLAERLLAAGSSPSQHCAQEELARYVREGLAQLPESDRAVLLMRTFERLAYDDIAYVLQIDPAAARQRHGRALRRLGRILRRRGLSES